MRERTLAIIKPDAREHTKAILERIKEAGFTIIAQRELLLKRAQIEEFYREHRGRPFFEALIDHMASGIVTILVLERKSPSGCREAWQDWRDLMGRTNPALAEHGTIRWEFGRYNELPKNVVHGSDSERAAEREIPFFFAGCELIC